MRYCSYISEALEDCGITRSCWSAEKVFRMRYIHYRFQCKTPFKWTGHIPGLTVCGICYLSIPIVIFLCFIGKYTRRQQNRKYFQLSDTRRNAVSTETILNYIKACEDAFLLYHVRRQDLQGKNTYSKWKIIFSSPRHSWSYLWWKSERY